MLSAWWMVFSGGSLLLAAAYAWLIRSSLQHWWAQPAEDTGAVLSHWPKVSVLVPGRNEAAHLPESLGALLAQDYPAGQFEIFFIDDHSTDNSLEVAAALSCPALQVLRLQDYLPAEAAVQAYKKEALKLGVQQSGGEIILTTDADCRVPPNWARAMVLALEQNDWQAITGPVLGRQGQGALQQFQSLDFAGMMLMTAAGLRSGQFTLGNGASLGFRRTAFEAVGGYTGNEQYASGDDVFLLRKVAEAFPGQLGFLKRADAAIRTEMKGSWRSFLQQRLRWGTKNSQAASGWGATLALGVVFLLSMAIGLALLSVPFMGWPALLLFGLLFAAKAISDYWLLREAAGFFGRPGLLRRFLLMEAMHTAYIVVVGTLSLVVRKYEWKGRRVE